MILGTVAYLGGLMSLPEEFAWSWSQLVKANTRHIESDDKLICYTRARKSAHHIARNQLVQETQGDWLLQLDTDHEFRPNLLIRMLATLVANPHIEVLSALNVSGTPPHWPALFHWDMKGNLIPIVQWDQEIVKVGSTGAGCLLVKSSVFDRIKSEMHCLPFDIIGKNNEDHSFFLRCKALDIGVYCDTSLKLGHWRMKSYSADDFQLPLGMEVQKYDDHTHIAITDKFKR